MMLEITNLSGHYGAVCALDSVSLIVPKGQVVSLLGANGAGKSTLLGSVMGIVPTVRGSIRFVGREILGTSTEEVVSMGIVLIPEGRQIFADLTVQENLQMGAYLRRDKETVSDDMETIRKLFPRLAERRKQLAGTLSGGEQQMLAMGRGFMSRPKLMLLDEPSLGLAPLLVTEIMRLIVEINRRGVTILLVEQNARQALRISAHAYVIEKGRVVISGRAVELAHNTHIVSAYLGASH
jgi:branched-chain amino acid transport system ATP-binding protein